MKKLVKITNSLILTFIMIMTSIITVKAAPDQIGIATARKINTAYIPNITFSYKYASDGKYLYCLNKNKKTASNIMANYVPNSSYIDGGITYIIKNGYPEKSITGDNEKDYYITQVAVWRYLDLTHGTNNLGNGFKKTKSDSTNTIINHVEKLVDNAIIHKNDNYEATKATLALSTSSFTLEDNNYVSGEIRANRYSGITEYTVTIDNPVKGMIIVPIGGKQFAYHGAFKMAVNNSFKIKVPASSVNTNTTISVSAEATGNTSYRVYEYQPTDTSMQNVAILEKTTSTAKSSTKLEIETTKVTITKIDATTKKALKGAKLVVKDADKNIVANITTTTEPYVINNLKNGTYTVEEVEAPEGYILSKDVKTFTLSTKNNTAEVTFENKELATLSVTKIDANTKKSLAGAVLVLKNSDGKELSRWTTTINAHIIKNLTAGTYTIEEISAPEGYLLNKKVTTVKITENEKSYKITIDNEPKSIVVNINKIDSATNKPLSGAILVLKDSTGKIIRRFTTTEDSYVITDIDNGVYTVEEESAPSGYIKSNEKITFTIDDDHLSHQITMKNTKEVIVPDTKTDSIIYLLIGAIVIGIGLEYILKHAKA